MKPKLILIVLLLFSGLQTQAQLLDELKKRAKEKGYETREVSLDTSDNAKYRTTSYEAEELVINSAKDFFTTDLIMKLYHDSDAVVHTQYFDAETIAMRTEVAGNSEKPLFQDRKGFIYGYNTEIGQYEKRTLASSGMLGFMMAGMIPQAYKLPQEPYLEAFQALEEKDLALSFMVLEMAFIYKPHHFKDNDYYTETKTKCNGSDNCTKFSYNDAEYPGSYILFDNQERLTELYINTINPQIKEEDHPTGKFVFSYENVNVKLPDAVEKSLMPGPLGKLIPLEKGLEPWKHNKKDKQKNKN
ncbi:hypothetical protein [Hwangdonia lutea]|uniref:GLPGLI family protein n=1 Tax=Hwangdonia lutea TaxID=3075823 RepID=A0AA97EMB1_9FLAO|nr:hypothetical protein [Hwangdonia sp. SCSIO 19198]WOD43807.1 hypothetical protein RNZ46_00740 [Hwangdonia sp. SCSIO 19198]